MMKREINTSRTGNHKKRNRSGKKWLWLFLLVVLVGILAGGVLARYRSDNQKQEEMKSSDFHITSDLLEEERVSYDVTDWRSGIDILLYNYEKENVALIAGDDISYTIKVDGKWVCTDPNKGVFKKSKDRTSQTIHLTPGTDVKNGDTVTITVNTTAPYKKTLSATFKVVSEGSPSYTVKDQSDGTVLLTILTNDYSGNITVKWQTGQLDPDSTNPDMADWSDASGQGILKAEDNTTYQLLFFKNITDSFTERSGMGTEINLTK